MINTQKKRNKKHKYNLLNIRTNKLVLPRNMSKSLCNTWNMIFQNACTRSDVFDKENCIILLKECLPTDTLRIVKVD